MRMRRFFRELQRREVIRTAGLYVGVVWILIEVASIFLPAFDAPDGLLRGLIAVAAIGLPVAILLAWFYDVTDAGIETQADATDTVVVPFGERRMDFVVIGILAAALLLSIYLNIASDRSAVVSDIEPLTVLIADFDNKTGEEVFDGTLEQALQIGIESAPFVSAYHREAARRVASTIPGTRSILDEATAQRVSVREGIQLVMVGSIEERNGGYWLNVRALDPMGGAVLTSVDIGAKDKLDVLSAIGTLAGDLREELDRLRPGARQPVTPATFMAMNLGAAKAYMRGQSLYYRGKFAEAMEWYVIALEYDPDLAYAHSGMALSAGVLGRTAEATQFWKKAVVSLDTMTERERLRTLAQYYSVVLRDHQKAIETYQTLVDRHPADDAAHSALALLYFNTLDFDNAFRERGVLLDIYPNSAIGRSNYALYAMYATDFDMAAAAAEKISELNPGDFSFWLPIAMQALADDNYDASKAAYVEMAKVSKRGQSTANLGLADIAMYAGKFDRARDLLQDGIASDKVTASHHFLSVRYVALAEAYFHQGDTDAALAAIAAGQDVSPGRSTLLPAALIYIAAGEIEAARSIADKLGDDAHAQSRAYSQLIDGLIALDADKNIEAIDSITAGIEFADLWLLRFYAGKAYLKAGHTAEALDEFTACKDREGEATSIFFDDLPTYRYMSTLPYWLGRAQEELGMQSASQENYSAFIERRPRGGPLANDARERLR